MAAQKRVCADEKLTVFLELESGIRACDLIVLDERWHFVQARRD
jgi:hypothetical protein